jgi:hypothetical protein
MLDTPIEVSDMQPSSGKTGHEEEESISMGLVCRTGVLPVAALPRLFQYGGKLTNLFQEELAESVMRHCIPYNPSSNSQKDLWLEYGAIGGELLGFDPTVTRGNNQRMQRPHATNEWGLCLE